MLKLLIVDDEYIVRQGMRKILPWEEMEVALVGEAENIEDALDLHTQKQHSVRRTVQIQFQCLSILQRLILLYIAVPWVQFIMITAHADKEYMLRAIYKEVCDYLFKPAKVLILPNGPPPDAIL